METRYGWMVGGHEYEWRREGGEKWEGGRDSRLPGEEKGRGIKVAVEEREGVCALFRGDGLIDVSIIYFSYVILKKKTVHILAFFHFADGEA